MAGVTDTPDLPASPGAAADPDATVVVRSWHNRVYNIIGMVGAAVLAGLFVVYNQHWPVKVVAALAAVGFLAWAVRGARVGVECRPDELFIREMTRTHRVPWGRVAGMSIRTDPRFKIVAPAVVLHQDEATANRRGGRLSAMSLADKKRPLVEARVRTLTEQWQRHVADSTA